MKERKATEGEKRRWRRWGSVEAGGSLVYLSELLMEGAEGLVPKAGLVLLFQRRVRCNGLDALQHGHGALHGL
jgi:hypothetical protein